jgi:8-oxo-dGTP diphosphatase
MKYCYDYPRPAVAVDVALICPRPNPQALLILRSHGPFADHWALPGGFLEMHETLEEAAVREVLEETGIDVSNRIQQLRAFSNVDRDPRGRVISIGFVAELSDLPTGHAADDAKDLRWFELNSLPPLAFDHQEILDSASAKLNLLR